MVRLSHLLTGSFAVFGACASSVLDILPSNFDDLILKSGKPSLVEYFAPWCGHCKNLAPVYDELAASFEYAKDKVVIGKVDADEHKDLGRNAGVQGFPTLKWYDGKSEKPIDYSSGRDLESLQAFITEKTGLKPRGKKAAPSNVEYLNDATFKEQIGGDKDVLLAVTTGWCGHCKALAPIWESVATDFAGESSVLIAKLDAEAPNAKQTAQDLEVKSYPTIKFFPKGSTEGEPYSGGRTEEALLAFVNEKAGTHRVAGGGLDATAGTIAALDTLVAQMTGKEDASASVAEQVKAAAGSLSDTYADYYVKVFGKMEANKGYLEKESKRLAGLLKKGGLAPAKVDDLVKRSNILARFQDAVSGVTGQQPKQEL